MSDLARRVALVVVVLLAATACGPGSREETLFIGPTRVECHGPFPTTCMWSAPSANGPWQLFYGGIQGFTWTPGYIFELRVRIVGVTERLQDGPSQEYFLIREIRRIPVP